MTEQDLILMRVQYSEPMTTDEENARRDIETLAGEIERLRAQLAAAQAKIDAVPVLSPDWDNAPEWANWWAVDADGEKYWYETEPIKGNATWWSADRCRFIDEDNSSTWRETLRKRPETQVQP